MPRRKTSTDAPEPVKVWSVDGQKRERALFLHRLQRVHERGRLRRPARDQLRARRGPRKRSAAVSRKRYIEFKDFEISPGSARGTAIIDGVEFKLRYAWKGLSEYDYLSGVFKAAGQTNKIKADMMRTWNNVICWTVRIEGQGVAEKMQALQKAIIIDEHGKDSVSVPRHKYPREILSLEPAHASSPAQETAGDERGSR